MLLTIDESSYAIKSFTIKHTSPNLKNKNAKNNVRDLQDLATSFLIIYSKELKEELKRVFIYTCMFRVALFMTARGGINPSFH